MGSKKKQKSRKKRPINNQRPAAERRAPAQSSRSDPAGARPKQTTAPKRPQPSAEQRRRTNRAYNQATVHRNVKGRKRGSRGRNYIMYYILGAVIVVIVLVILANTVLFNCSSIEVEGNSRYTAEQIIAPSGLEEGQNLLHIDTEDAAERISTALTYIDMTEVKRVFPTKIKITVKEAEKWFQVSQNGVTACISRMGRIVELGSDSSLPLVVGFDPEELTAGKTLASTDSGKTSIPALILEKAEQYGIESVTQIDVTDRFDITIDCGDNITLQLGGISDIDSKFAVAVSTIEEEKANVFINLHDPSTIFARDKVSEQAQQTLPELGSPEEPDEGEPQEAV